MKVYKFCFLNHFIKVLFVINILTFARINVNAQFQINLADTANIVSYEDLINDVFGNLDKTEITTGILYNRVICYSPVEKYTGTNPDTVTDLENWKQMYFEIYNAHVNPPTIPTIFEVDSLATLSVNNGTIPIAIMNFNYNIIKDSAVVDGLLQLINNQLIDVSNRPDSPYHNKRVFAASSLKDQITQTNISFSLDASFYFTNDTNIIQYLEIDFDDGLGFRTFNFGDIALVSYSTSGLKEIELKAFFQNKVLSSKFQINVSASLGSHIPPPDNTVSITANISHNGVFASGQYGIWYGCESNNAIRKPILVVEGFDPNIPNKDRNFTVHDDKRNLYAVTNQEGTSQAGVADKLRADGYDIIILNFDDGTDFIQRSAFLLVKLIQEINAQKTTDHELIIIGPSSGALIARYALAYMEANNLPHHTKLFVSFDGVHQGANIPLGLQHFINFISNTTQIISLTLWDAVKVLRDKTLNPSQAKQMLVYHYSETSTFCCKANPHNLKDNFYTELKNLIPSTNGYPAKVRNVAIANGSGNASGQSGMFPGKNLLTWLIQTPRLCFFCPSVRIFTKVNAVPDNQGKIIFEGLVQVSLTKLLPFIPVNIALKKVNNTDPYDNAPGGTQTFHKDIFAIVPFALNKDLNEDNFVPTISALDLQNTTDLFYNVHANITGNNDIAYLSNPSITPFDAIFVSVDNEPHVIQSMTQPMADWVKSETSPADLFLQNRTITDAADFEARNTITIGSNVTNTTPVGNFIVESGANATFRAGNKITGKPGFHIKAGSSGHAFIDPFLCASQCKTGYAAGNDDPTTETDIFAPEAIVQEEAVQEEKVEETKPFSSFNYPNPFSEHTHIDYYVNEPGSVVLSVSNVYGQTIATLVNQSAHSTGQFTVTFDARNNPAGVYYYTIRLGNAIVETHKMILTK